MTEINQGTNGNEPENRTFTQDEMNAIIGERLSKERAKFADYEEFKIKAAKLDEIEEANKTELQKATDRADALQAQLDKMIAADNIRKIRETISKETGVPAALLTGETDDDCLAQAQAILDYAKPTGYPKVPDSGEVGKVSETTPRAQFEKWAEEQLIGG